MLVPGLRLSKPVAFRSRRANKEQEDHARQADSGWLEYHLVGLFPDCPNAWPTSSTSAIPANPSVNQL